jgi:hypothetical protein
MGEAAALLTMRQRDADFVVSGAVVTKPAQNQWNIDRIKDPPCTFKKRHTIS